MITEWFGKKAVPLSGRPAVRRQKAYSAQTGYVYQYFYEGYRESARERGTEYVFDVSADRKTSAPVSVLISDAAVESWQKETGRTLSGTEKYAVAKMALFQAFDERATPEAMRGPVRVLPADIQAILATLNID
jgi:hypothetical protein